MMMNEKLNSEWVFRRPIDFEYNKYIALNYIKSSEGRLNDLKIYPDIIQAGKYPNIYYTNSSQLPVGFTEDPYEALLRQDDLQCKYTGGTVLHLYMDGKLKTLESCKDLVKKSLTNFKLPYITVTPLFSVCPTHGYISGEHEYCPKCDEEIIAEHNKNLK